MKSKLMLLMSGLFMASTITFAQVQPTLKPVKKKADASKQSNVTDSEPAKKMPIPVKTIVSKPDVLSKKWVAPASELTFDALPYAFNALEPVIDQLTVEIHYDRHHRAYFNNFMKAIKETKAANMPVSAIFANISSFPDAVRNNGGGFFNHVLYWENLSPDGGGEPSGTLASAISKTFGSYAEFVKQFEDAGKTRFGSGWAWLSVDPSNGELFISSTPNQDNPLMNTVERQGTPILALDVWEHAYYLNYQNKRADYISAFWKLVNWKEVENRYTACEVASKAMKK